MGNRAAIYCRISSDVAGEGLGVQRQEADCRRLCEAKGFDVVGVYVDNDISAYSGKRRPNYSELLRLMAAGQVDAVICWHTDRLHRSPKELEEYIDVSDRYSVTTHAVQSGELDLATASGRAVARTLGAWARFESEQKSDRIRRAKQQAVEEGRYTGGPRPFGWNMDRKQQLTVNEEEAAWLRRCSEKILAGASLRSLVSELKANNVPTSRGGVWGSTTLRQVLLRPANAGMREVAGALVPHALFPPIVREDTLRGVRAVLMDPARRKTTGTVSKWMLTGIARCQCGAPMTIKLATSRGRAYKAYCCTEPGKGHVTKNADRVHELIDKVMPGILARPEVWEVLTAEDRDDAAALATQAAALRARLEEATESFAEGILTKSQLERITVRIRAKLEELEVSMVSVNRSGMLQANGRTPETVWAEASLEQRRMILRTVVRVTMVTPTGPRNQFDPTSVRIEPAN